MAILEVKDIKKSFGKTEVLKGVSFSLEKGQVLAIIGSSGSGKTTLLRCLNFLETPDEGEILINGQPLFQAGKRLSDQQVRENRLHFGLVFQNFNLFPQYTALKNVMLAPSLLEKNATCKLKEKATKLLTRIGLCKKQNCEQIQGAESSSAELEARATQLLTQVGLADKLQNYPHQLSGGQQQRVAIARALALHPQVLCFDEPTSALDPELTGEVLRVIRGLKSDDSTMIVVTHEMEFARSVADKVIYMADGVIVEMGTPEEVFDNPQNPKTKAFLYGAQARF